MNKAMILTKAINICYDLIDASILSDDPLGLHNAHSIFEKKKEPPQY